MSSSPDESQKIKEQNKKIKERKKETSRWFNVLSHMVCSSIYKVFSSDLITVRTEREKANETSLQNTLSFISLCSRAHFNVVCFFLLSSFIQLAVKTSWALSNGA